MRRDDVPDPHAPRELTAKLKTLQRMSNLEGGSLAFRAALARRQYWIEQRDAALAAGDKELAAHAERSVAEYDALLHELDQRTRERAMDTTGDGSASSNGARSA